MNSVSLRRPAVTADLEKVEEELRTQTYTALVELAFAQTKDKRRIIKRLSTACGKLQDLILHEQIPKM